MLFVAVDGRLGAGPWQESAAAAVPRGASSSLSPGSAGAVGEDLDASAACVLLWTRKMVENQRRRHTLSPWSGFTEHLLGGAPVPTLSGGEATQRRSPPSTSTAPAAAIAIAAGSPVAYASATGPDGMPIGVVYHGSPVKNAQEIRELYGLPPAAADCGAQLLLDLYGAGFVDAYGDNSDQPATALSCIQATFTFVLLDADSRCLLAARSAADAPPLYWGSAADGALLFASEADALQSLCDRPTGGAAPFPAGCFYLAADDDRPPQIVGFTRSYAHREVTPVPRINSSGQLCSLGFYSQSGTDLANMSVGSMLYPSVGWTM